MIKDDLIEEMLEQNRLQFREWLKDDVKAEFINGEVVMHSPVKRGHLEVTENLFPLLRMYVVYKKLGKVSVEKALVGMPRNDYEPDICYWTNQQAADFHKETMVHPAPTLVIEILSKGTKNKDRGVKFKDYATNGILEYWMVDYKKETVEQYKLSNKAYELHQKLSISDTIKCLTIKGFTIPVKAIFDEDVSLKTLRKLIQ